MRCGAHRSILMRASVPTINRRRSRPVLDAVIPLDGVLHRSLPTIYAALFLVWLGCWVLAAAWLSWQLIASLTA